MVVLSSANDDVPLIIDKGIEGNHGIFNLKVPVQRRIRDAIKSINLPSLIGQCLMRWVLLNMQLRICQQC